MVTFWAVAVNCCVPPTPTIDVPGDIETEGGGGGGGGGGGAGAWTVSCAFALLVGSAMLVAVTVCAPAWLGAVYKPVALIVPTEEFPPALLSTAHVTAVFELPFTVAVNWAVVPV